MTSFGAWTPAWTLHAASSPLGSFFYGRASFRQKVLIDLQSAFGLRVIKRSLGTRNMRLAPMGRRRL